MDACRQGEGGQKPYSFVDVIFLIFMPSQCLLKYCDAKYKLTRCFAGTGGTRLFKRQSILNFRLATLPHLFPLPFLLPFPVRAPLSISVSYALNACNECCHLGNGYETKER